MLSKAGIIKAYEEGTIVYAGVSEEDFHRNLNTNSINVTLGENFYILRNKTSSNLSYLPFGDKEENALHWELRTTKTYLMLEPGQTILCHTQEFVGARSGYVPNLKARSTSARFCVTVCDDAGFGDVGYISRWAMRLTNHNFYPIQIPVGAAIAQIYFSPLMDHVPEGDVPILCEEPEIYTTNGNYQSTDDLEELIRTWNPRMLLGLK